MKKTNLLYFIGIGLLAFLPFISVSVAAPPCWVGINLDDTYSWNYEMGWTARDADWTTDGISLLIFANMDSASMFWVDDDQMAYLMPGNMSHEITAVEDLAADIEFGTGYMGVSYSHALAWESAAWTGDWEDKDTLSNIYQGLIVRDESEFVLFNKNLTRYFDMTLSNIFPLTSLFVPTNFDWTDVVTAANTGLTDINATATVLTNSTTAEEIGFKVSIAALAWGTNTLALELEVTFDECGLLDDWDLTYGGDSILTITQIAGSTCTPCSTGGDAIPGYELPIIIGVASIISLILIKKIKNK